MVFYHEIQIGRIRCSQTSQFPVDRGRILTDPDMRVGFRIHEFIGWPLWRALYLSKIPTMAAKVRVHFEWTWATFFAGDPGCLEFEHTRLPEQDVAGAASPDLAILVKQLDTRL